MDDNQADGTMIQIQQQEKKGIQHEKREQFFILTKDAHQNKGPALSMLLTKEILLSEAFPLLNKKCSFRIDPLDEILTYKFSNWEQGSIDSNILVTRNYLSTMTEQMNMGDEFEKTIKHLLLVQKGQSYQLVVLSIDDASSVATIFSEISTLHKSKKMWLLRPSGDLAWGGPSAYKKMDLVEKPEVARLIVQALFINGQFKYLELPHWYNALKAWLISHPNRQLLILYFKEVALRFADAGAYNRTRVSVLLDELYSS